MAGGARRTGTSGRSAAVECRAFRREREQPCRNAGQRRTGSTQSAHVNLIWSPVANTDLGVEYIVASRTTEDGQSGHLNRLQAAAKYSF